MSINHKWFFALIKMRIQLNDATLVPCYTVPKFPGGTQLFVRFSATLIQIPLIPLLDSFPIFGSPRKRDHFRIHAVTPIKRCQASYRNAFLNRCQTNNVIHANRFILCFNTTLLWNCFRHFTNKLVDCCSQCGPFHHSLQSLSLDAGIPLVIRIFTSWRKSPLAWCYSLVNILKALFATNALQ